MVLQTVRVGALVDVFQYDDVDYDCGVETTVPIKAGAPVDPTDVVRQTDLPTFADIVNASANINDNAVVRGDGGTRKVQGSNVTVDDNGSTNIPTGEAYKVNNIQVVTDQQAAEADAGAVAVMTITAGADTIDIAATDADIATMIGEINDIRTTLNNLLAKLRTHGLIDT